MSPGAIICAVAGDPGGANALLPVLQALAGAGFRVVALPYREAVTLWSKAGVAISPLGEDPDAASYLRDSGASLLLTATSMNGVDLEKRFIAAARGLRVPSLAVLDFWSHYRERFAGPPGTPACLPDRIAVMDDAARDALRQCGVEESRLVITGQPAFDALAGHRQRFTIEDRARVRALAGAGPGDRLIAFLSQPLSETVGDKYGFTETSVLEEVAAALARIQQRRRDGLVLLIRPHPREALEKFRGCARTDLRNVVSAQENGRDVVLASDLVVGMNTVLLLEACLLGCLALSVQPGLRGEDVLPSNRSGWSRAVYNRQHIEPTLEKMLFDETARAEVVARLGAIRPPCDATSRVVTAIRHMLSQGAERL